MEFLKTLCTVAALLSLALLFVPEKQEIKRAASTAFSLLLLLFLIPKDGSFALPDLLSFEDAGDLPTEDIYGETLKDAVAAGIKSDLASHFSLVSDGVLIDTDLAPSEEGFEGTYLSVTLSRENFFADVTSLLRYLKNTYPVDCEVHFLGS